MSNNHTCGVGKVNDTNKLERCTRCTIPITWETIYFDENGVCNVCKNWETKQKKINWQEREKQLLAIFNEAKERKLAYDCIVPYSGGKDSTFTLWAVVKKYGLKPLVVSFDHCFYRPRTLENRTRTFRKLGVDVLTFTPNWHVVRKLMLESLFRKGDFCWHCHAGVYVYPMQVAVKYKIPLLIWGEGGGEYEGYFKVEEQEALNEWKFNRRINLGLRAEDFAGFLGVDLRYLEPFIYPSRDDLDNLGVKSISLGNFIPWDVQKQVQINKEELGWQEDEIESGLPGPTYEKIECMFTGVRDYIKYLKRGYSRITHLTMLDINHGRMDRKTAMQLIEKYEARKPQSLKIFLEYVGISEDEFHNIVFKHLIPPAPRVDMKSLGKSEKLWDQDLWFRE